MAKKKIEKTDPLAELLGIAPSNVLADLILQVTAFRPDIRRECFDFLKTRAAVSKKLEKRSQGEIALSLWAELEPDLNELDEYGGGEYDTEDHVAELLDQLRSQLESGDIEPEIRRQLLDEALTYLESGNAGMDDPLYEVVHATCYDDSDLRRLAEAFEAMQDEYKTADARRIYRQLGDRQKYLELRSGRMVFGADYHDLATFYWEAGEKDKALKTAERGLRKGKGRMDELRRFVAERAKETGNRERYLELQFDQATDGLTLEKYKAFKKTCTPSEWGQFEPNLLRRLKQAGRSERLKIRMHRKEYDQAVAVLAKGRYPIGEWDITEEVRIAQRLEKRYPEAVLKYYLTGLGNLKSNALRKEYARKAKVMAKVRRVIVTVIGDEARWKKFAGKIKQDNIRRPAFQEEFAKAVKGWHELS